MHEDDIQFNPTMNPYAANEVDVRFSNIAAVENPGYQIKVNIVIDIEYVINAWSRFRDRGPSAFEDTGFYMCIGAVTLMAIVGAVFGRSYLVSSVVLVAVIFMFVNRPPRFASAYFIRRGARKSTYLNEKLTITLTDQCFYFVSSFQEGGLAWSTFSKVVGFSDGVVLYRGRKPIYWIPFRTLENATDSSILYGYLESRIAASNSQSG